MLLGVVDIETSKIAETFFGFKLASNRQWKCSEVTARMMVQYVP